MTDSTSTAVYHDLIVERDVDIRLRDGERVVADVFRPDTADSYGVIITMGPYSKDIHFKDWSQDFDYSTLAERGPHMHWETVNPEWWVPARLRRDSSRRPRNGEISRSRSTAFRR